MTGLYYHTGGRRTYTDMLGIAPEKCPHNIDRYGNCSAASIPMLLDECVREGRARTGDLVSMTSFGSGFSWTSSIARL